MLWMIKKERTCHSLISHFDKTSFCSVSPPPKKKKPKTKQNKKEKRKKKKKTAMSQKKHKKYFSSGHEGRKLMRFEYDLQDCSVTR